MPLHLARRWTSYTEPFEPLIYAAWSLRITLFDALGNQASLSPHSGVSFWGRWRDEAFALWYKTLNQNFLRFEARTAVPSLVSHATGLTIDLGPALGNQIPSFNEDAVSRVFGIEKNPFFVKDLQAKIDESEMQDKYTILSCGVEKTGILESYGIEDGGVDTILCIQVLCSVADPDAVARRLYELLKPGGKLIFWEHHRNKDIVTRIFQYLWNPLWWFGIGDCSMTRDPLSTILRAGEWEGVESVHGDEQPWSMLPRVWGELVKSRAK